MYMASVTAHPTLNRHSPPEVVANFKRRVPPRLPKPRRRPEPVLPYTAPISSNSSRLTVLSALSIAKPLASTSDAATGTATGNGTTRSRYSLGSAYASWCGPRTRLGASASATCRSLRLGIRRALTTEFPYPRDSAAPYAAAFAIATNAIQ